MLSMNLVLNIQVELKLILRHHQILTAAAEMKIRSS